MKRLTLYWLNFSDELNASSFHRYDFYLVFNASTVLFFLQRIIASCSIAVTFVKGFAAKRFFAVNF
jgi:hypothetical protein